LIVFTGDVADDLAQLAPALALADGFRARAGVFASLGNHEYLRGIRDARAVFDKSRVPLLVGRGGLLSVGRARVWVGGGDDPVATHGNIHPFLRATVAEAMRGAPRDAFQLLLCHRPEGFDEAERAGASLTLSGHTHGGQIGYNGKSAFEALWPDGYLWGAYRRRDAWLYTTSGFGHWFPFRVGCPTEAPLLVLRRGPSNQPPSV
jgi:predicted MPP superfamily phosphohydrolase